MFTRTTHQRKKTVPSFQTFGSEIPGPRGLPFIGNLLEINHAELHEQLYEYALQYGELVQLQLLDQQAILISAPSLIEQIFIQDREHVYRNIYTKFYGKKLGWLDGALIGRPLFTHPCHMNANTPPLLDSDLATLPSCLPELVQTRLTEWACSAKQGPISLYSRLVRLSFDVMSQIIFGEQMPENFFRDFLSMTQGADFHSRTGLPSPAPSFWLAWQRWHRELARIVKQMQKDPARSPDSALAQILISSTPLKKDVLIAELAAIFAGGVHPIATALLSLIYTFNKYTDAAEGVFAEAQLTQETLTSTTNLTESHLPSLNHFINETLRLYPPVAVLSRTVKADRQLTLAGHPISGGTQLLFSSWAMHRHPAYWENPLRFLPNRFDTTPNTFCYFPFGIGHHACLGKKLTLHLVRTLAWHLCHDTRIAIDTREPLLMQQSAGFLKPKHYWRAEVINPEKSKQQSRQKSKKDSVKQPHTDEALVKTKPVNTDVDQNTQEPSLS